MSNRRVRFAIAAAVMCVSFTALAIFRSTHHAVSQVAQITAKPATSKAAPATITAITTLLQRKSSDDAVGTALVAGRQTTVDDGAIEVTLASGATVIIQAPAQFHVVDSNTLALLEGRLTAHVPLSAHGFGVISPGLLSVDRGTDFGIRTLTGSTASEVHIFGGSVDVTGTDAFGKLNSPVVHAVTSDAFRHDVTQSTGPIAVQFSPQAFNRDINSIRRPVPIHNTGDGLAAGAADPNWQIESAPDELHLKPVWHLS